jgi:hypothetical protein
LTGGGTHGSGIGAFVKDKPSKVVPEAEQDNEQTCKQKAFHSTLSHKALQMVILLILDQEKHGVLGVWQGKKGKQYKAAARHGDPSEPVAGIYHCASQASFRIVKMLEIRLIKLRTRASG